MTYRQKQIWAEIHRTEKLCEHYHTMLVGFGNKGSRYYDDLLEFFHHVMGRRRFYIAELQKFQLKEFNYE